MEQHTHGSGFLSISVAGAEFTLSLAVPGTDIVGFEHPAADDEDRALVAVAISDLTNPLELFVVPEEAGCFAVSANVTLVDGAHSHDGEGAADNQEQGDAVSSTSEETTEPHTEFQAEYLIRCQDPDAVDDVRFDYFERFENAEELVIEVQSIQGERSFSVARETPLANLAGMF
ncbi:DUF2796 domain-containing protein [Roseibium sp. RKSG952]|uniref:ZrgA family zinc uptake protein n=1 Tax=Roseibium sp. RKSG952 TaxID=2529384 RepID=UPI0018AD2F1F|nr:DUF2796 domain-containing protein [Roseibium sp. RKSG952]